MESVVLLSNDKKNLKLVSSICKEYGYIFFYIDSLEEAKKFLLNEKVTVVVMEAGFISSPIAFIQTMRNFGCDASFIYIGDGDRNEVRFFLKNGFYDYLNSDFEKIELATSIEEAIENKYAFEGIRSLAEELEKSNEKLIQRTKELEIEKIHLNEIVDVLKLIDNFVKDLNKSDFEKIPDIIDSYISVRFQDRYYIITKVYEENKEDISVTNIPDKFAKFDTLFKGIDLKRLGNNESRGKVKLKLDKEYFFLVYPIWYEDNYFGSILIEGNMIEEYDDFYLTLISEHLALNVFNKKLLIDLQEAKDKLLETERQKTLLNLAVSLNHIINNNLLGISLNFEYIKKFCNDDNELHKSFDIIEKNIDTIKKVVEKLQKVKDIKTEEYLPGINMLKLSEESEN
ncbi:hypothetical protein FHQ18_00660 [Deferribacter autotrophicus]|uniref:Signal transduction histidine kinase dimerisation/phosphoacceptor domain-containing protein n=1 Tax=Deferribacter autotrophicus TaxID=500465 RepID=A0A5A8F760_9BACT|nr:hypothetical protein [Deferribacter autotrophicus]KAA0259423.1 hypothetical protein FHQ18_00660 [Deferribacter autotrophicus]